MLKSEQYWYGMLFVLAFACPKSAAATTLLQDDFNDNSIDSSKWFTATPFGDSSIIETNQRLEIANRGYLNSQQQFNPSLINGGLQITGKWTFTSATFPGHDFMQMLTRSDGTPGGGTGETTNGIEFHANGNDFLVINQYTNGIGVNIAGPTPIPINNGESFLFDIRDDGFNLYFSFSEIGGDGSSAVLTGTSAQAYATNHIVFHNRESSNGGIPTLSFLDDVVVSAVPEPSSLVVLGLGLAVLLTVVARRRQQRGTHSP